MSGRRGNVRTDASTAWLTGLMLGGLTGLTSISWALGLLAVPILVASVVLIVWKGPRAIAGTGFLTGIGLLWTVLLATSTLSCLTIDRTAGRCEPAEGVWRFLAAGGTMLVLGLLLSAEAFRRLRSRQ
ncbi:MAG TPA: hypothetical protein VNL94_02175 [Candidatus Binatia bacterium]|nr:hypothetical protein [Candidatus Binatia bacterium]